MWRRRMLNRVSRVGTVQQVNPILIEANQLFASGRYEQAVVLYEQLAGKAAARQGPHTPHFLLQAGRCHFLLNEIDRGMAVSKQALIFLSEQKKWNAILRIGENLSYWLVSKNLLQPAEQIKTIAAILIPKDFRQPTTPARQFQLPAKCPNCGAPVHGEEMDLDGAQFPRCGYCGIDFRD